MAIAGGTTRKLCRPKILSSNLTREIGVEGIVLQENRNSPAE